MCIQYPPGAVYSPVKTPPCTAIRVPWKYDDDPKICSPKRQQCDTATTLFGSERRVVVLKDWPNSIM